MKTKLLINLNPLRPPLTGIGYYTKNIIKECLKRDIDLVGIKNGRLLNSMEIEKLISSLEIKHNVTHSPSTSLKKKLIEFVRTFPGIYAVKYFLISLRAKKTLSSLGKKGFTYFEPSFVPMKYSGDVITTVHDLSFLTYPEFHPTERVNFLTKMVKKTVSVSSHIVVDSNFIKKELFEYYSVSPDQVSTVYLGVENNFRIHSKQETQSTLDRFKLIDNNYILSVATLEPRKNLAKLVDSYRGLPQEIKNTYPLVLVGNSGWKNNILFNSIEDLVSSGNIIVTGYLSDMELNRLYSSATLFVYPSLYEGFGLPIIEAMASGTAVLTSNCGATAEVAGDAAFLVDPKSTLSITNGITSLLLDQDLRVSLEKKSINRAEYFRWHKCVDEILSVADNL